jgi:hypothetical protein
MDDIVKVFLVMDKYLEGGSRTTLKLYGIFSDKAIAEAVANRVMADRASNPFLAGNLRGSPYESNKRGYLNHTRPKVIEVELDATQSITLSLDKYTIDTFWKEEVTL